MFNKMKKVIFSFLVLYFILIAFVFATVTATPSQVTQDDTITISVYIDGTGVKEPTTEVMYNPTFVVEGFSSEEEVSFRNRGLLQGKFKVLRNANIGNHTVTVYAITGAASGSSNRATLSDSVISIGTTTIKVISKPMILGVSPGATFQQASKAITFYGKYFDTSGASMVTISGAGVSGTVTPTTTSVAPTFNLSNGTPGGPYSIQILSNDGGVGFSDDGSGNPTPIFTLYPAPSVISVNRASVYQAQESVEMRIRGTGFHAQSSVDLGAGISILGVTSNADGGEITVNFNVDKNATLGNRTLTVYNPDGAAGTANKATFVINSFVTQKLTPNVNAGISTTTVVQGFKGDITIKSVSGAGNGFDDLAVSEVLVSGENITVSKVVFVDTSTLKVSLIVEPTAEIGDRAVTIKNLSYKTLSTYTLKVEKAPEAKLEDVNISVSPASLYQGEFATVTVTCANGAAFESGANLKVTASDGITIKNITYMSSTTLWCYLKIDEKAQVGERTFTVENVSYKVQKSTYITILESDFNKLAINAISPNELYQGQSATVTVTVAGKIENTAEVSFKGIGITLNGYTKKSDAELWLDVTVDKLSSLGQHAFTIKNPTYEKTVTGFINISTSSYSNPFIDTITDRILYQGEQKQIVVTGRGFRALTVFTFSDPGIVIQQDTIVIESPTKAILTVNIPIDLEPKSYALVVKNTDFEASFIKQDAVEVREKHSISSISPQMLAPGTSEYFYINGTNFDLNSAFKIFVDGKVVVNSTSTTTYDQIVFVSSRCVSKNQIACSVLISSDVKAGIHDIGLYFESNGATITQRGILNIPNRPVITNIPSTLSQGDNNKEVTIQGQNFENGATVVISGSGIIITSVTVISSNIMTFRCDVSKDAERTDRQIKVINPTGQFATGLVKVISPPIIESCSPSNVMKGTTRYLEISGQNFSEFFDLNFSGRVTTTTPHSDDAINIISVKYTGNTQLLAEVYIGTNVINGMHDIMVVNYEDSTKASIQSQGIGAGLLDVRTPLKISTSTITTVPAGYSGKVIAIRGEGFSKNSVISINGSGITITHNNFINTQEIEIVIDVAANAPLGRRTVTIKDSDNSAYASILDVIQAVTINSVTPINIPIGLRHATMTVVGLGIDIPTTTIVTKNGVKGIDPGNYVEILGGGIDSLVIDSTTYSSTSMTLYFQVFSTATVGSRDIRITNKDSENILFKQAAFNLVESIKIDLFSPTDYQIAGAVVDFKIIGSGFDPTNNYGVDGSTIIFSNPNVSITAINYRSGSEISGQFTWLDQTAVITNRSVDLKVVNKDGSIGTKKGALYLVEQLEVIDASLTPTTIPVNAKNYVVNIKGKGLIKGVTAYFYLDGPPQDFSKIVSKKLEYIDTTEMNLYIDSDAGIADGALATLVVTNPNGASVEKSGIFVVKNVPTIHSFVPDYIRVGGEKDVVIQGANLNLVTRLEFSNGLYITTTSITSGEIRGRIKTTAGTYPGDVTVKLYTATVGNEGIARKLFKVLEGPKIREVLPNILYAEKEVQFYVNGDNFDENIKMVIRNIKDGSTDYIHMNDSTSLGIRKSTTRIILEKLKIDKEGEYSLELINPDGSSVKQDVSLTVYPQATQAQIFSLSPPYGKPKETNKIIEVTGNNFLPGMTVYAQGAGITVSSYTVYTTSASLTLEIAETAEVGEYGIAFLNPFSSPTIKKFYIVDAPVVESIYPDKLQKGTTNQITVKGRNFMYTGGSDGGDIALAINSSDGVSIFGMNFIGTTELKAYVFVSENAVTGKKDLVVTNPFGVNGTGRGLINIEDRIEFNNINPSTLTQGTKNKDLVINGKGFKEETKVEFVQTGIILNKTTYINDNQLSVNVTVADDAAVGNVDVRIINDEYNNLVANKVFSIVPRIRVEKINNNILYRGKGTAYGDDVIVEIIGSNFTLSTSSNIVSECKVELIGADNEIQVVKVETKSSGNIFAYIKTNQTAKLGFVDMKIICNSDKRELIVSNAFEVVDKIKINNVTPSNIMLLKNAFNITNSGAVATYSISVTHLTLSGVAPILLAGKTVDQLISAINAEAGWTATLSSSQAGRQPATYLKTVGTTDVANGKTSIASFTKNGIFDNSGSEVTLNIAGSGFAAGINDSKLLFSGNGISITNTNFVSDKELTAKITFDPALILAGKRDLTITNLDNTFGIAAGIVEFVEPLEVSQVSPQTLARGAVKAPITIKGKGFSDNLLVTSGSSLVSVSDFKCISRDEISFKVTIDPTFISPTNIFTLKSATGESVPASINVEQLPVITSVVPNELGQGASTWITISGYKLANIITLNNILFSQNDISILDMKDFSDTGFKVLVNVSKSAQLGDKTVTLKDFVIGKENTNSGVLSIVAEPSIVSFNPDTLFLGSVGEIILKGSGFVNGTILKFSSPDIKATGYQFFNNTEMKATLNISSVTIPALYDVEIVNPDRSNNYYSGLFNVVDPERIITSSPIITGISVAALTQGATYTVFLEGENFLKGTNVSFSNNDGLFISNINVLGSKDITFDIFVSTTSKVGKHDISVITNNGTVTATGLLNIVSPLKLDRLDPKVLSRGTKSRDVWIYGAGFDDTTKCLVDGDGVTIENTYYLTDKLLRIVVTISESAVLGTRKVSLVNGNGSKVEVEGAIDIIPAVTVTRVSPDKVGIGSLLERIEIEGTEFRPNLDVKILGSGVSVSSIEFRSDTQVNAYISVSQDASAGSRDIRVINKDGNEGIGKGVLTLESFVKVNSMVSEGANVNYFTLTPGTTHQEIIIRGDGFRLANDLVTKPTISFSLPYLSIEPGTMRFMNSAELRATLWVDTGSAHGGDKVDVRVTNPDGTTGLGKNLYIISEPLALRQVIPNMLGAGAQNETLSINGQGFIDGIKLEFFEKNHITIHSIKYINANQIEAKVSIDEAMTVGYATFSVINPGNVKLTTSTLFSIEECPVVNLVTPDHYAQGALNQNIKIGGRLFDINSTTVTISGGVTVASTTVESSTSIIVNVSVDKSAAVGAKDIIVESGGKVGIGRGVFKVVDAPTILEVIPNTIAQGAQNRVIEIKGRGFVSKSSVTVNIPGLVVNNVAIYSGEKISLTVSVDSITSSPNYYDINIANPDGSSGVGTRVLQIKEPPTPPVMISIIPKMMAAGSSNQNIIIEGQNLQDGINMIISGGGVTVSTVNRSVESPSTRVYATISIDAGAVIGKRDVLFVNPDGGFKTYAKEFEIITNPVIDSMDPSVVIKDTTTAKTIKEINIIGKAFSEYSIVEFTGGGITVDSFTFVGEDHLRIDITVATNALSGYRDVIVNNPYGMSGKKEGLFRISEPVVITKITPNQASQGVINKEIRIEGTNFMEGASLDFSGSGITVSSLNVVSSSLILGRLDIADTATTSKRKVTIINRTGASSMESGTDMFEVTPKPSITEVYPKSLEQGTSSWITIKGKGFYQGMLVQPIVTVSGEGVSVSSVQYNGEADVQAFVIVSSVAVRGMRDVIVQNTDSSSTTIRGEAMLEIIELLNLKSINLTKIPRGDKSRQIILNGGGFEENAKITFSGTGITVSTVSWKSSNQLVAVVDVDINAEIGLRSVTVENPNTKKVTLNSVLQVVDPIFIATLEPSELGVGVADKEIRIKGTGFEPNSTVVISGDGIVYSTVSCSATEIILKASVTVNATLGFRSIEIQTPEGNRGKLEKAINIINHINITEISPKYIEKGFNGTVYIKGYNFDVTSGIKPVVQISGDGLVVGVVTAVSSTELQVHLTVQNTATIGTRDVTITNADGAKGFGKGGIEITDALSFARLEPNNLGKGAKNEIVCLYGKGLVEDTKLEFSSLDVVVSSLQYISNDQLKLTISIPEAAATGAVDLLIKNPNNINVPIVGAFSVTDSPTITKVEPSEIAQGALNQELKITGTNISANATFAVSGLGVNISSMNIIDSRTMKVWVNVKKTATVGDRDVVITNTLAATSSFGIGKGLLKIIDGPSIETVSPEIIAQEDVNRIIELKGKGFKPGLKLEIVDAVGVHISSLNYVSSEILQILVNVDNDAPTRVYDIKVTNLDSGQDTRFNAIKVVHPPRVVSVNTPIVQKGDIEKMIEITGNNFEMGAAVYIGDMTTSTVTYVSSSKLIVKVIVAQNATEGAKDITVINPNGIVGIGKSLIKIVEKMPIIKNVTLTSKSIEYEKISSAINPLLNGVSFYYELVRSAKSVELAIYRSSELQPGQEVKRVIRSNLQAGVYNNIYNADKVFYWDGSIEYKKKDDGSSDLKKENGDYRCVIRITSDEGQVEEWTETITVDVVNINDQYVEYTLMGQENVKVSPYKLHYTLSKPAYTKLEIVNSSGTLVREFGTELSSKGENVKIWDGRDLNGVRLSKGIYKVILSAYDTSNPVDEANIKNIAISVDQLVVADVKIDSIRADKPETTISFVPSETMRVDLVIYKPKTMLGTATNGSGTVVPSPSGTEVKVFNLYVEKGTTYQVTWGGKNDRGDMLVDGDYPFAITGKDSHGIVMGQPYISVIAINRAANLEMRREMFKKNSYAYPNPVDFKKVKVAKINYGINNMSNLNLYIYDVLGNIVWEKRLDNVDIGEGQINWALINNGGKEVGRGLYVYVLEAEEINTGKKLKTTNKIMVIK